jgi:photosystem II stability/assembly factor-like uncharacterized protein
MKSIISIAGIILLAAFLFYKFPSSPQSNFIQKSKEQKEESEYAKTEPSEWFYTQRAYPLGDILVEKYFDAMKKKNELIDASSMTVAWNPIGPTNIGGRVTCIVADPANPNIIIIGAAAGGIFKTTNGGLNWTAKTDFAPALGMSSLEMDPNNSNIIYAGTGEANSAIDCYPGYGVLKSTNKGDTWSVIGLSEVLNISSIKVHPLNSNIVYAGGMGYRSKSVNKGIYKSTDAGQTWNKVLFVSDSTSAIDVGIDYTDVNIVYAAMWERIRPPSISSTGGISSGLYRSSNGGTNWVLLGTTNGLPAPSGTTGRININVSKANSSIVHAIYRTTNGNNISGVYKSTNKGLNWTSLPITGVESSGFDWYFGLIETAPSNANTLYIGSVDVFRTTNAGVSWTNLTNAYSGTFDQQHPDQHCLWINPANNQSMILGNDGGIFTTSDGGTSWSKKYDLPISQYYAACIDFINPAKRYGGTQDNGSHGSINPGPAGWSVLYGGDGFHCAVDYTNSNVIYMESQNGGIGRSDDGGTNFDYIAGGLDLTRTNWSSPYMLDIQNPSIVYFGSYVLNKSTDKGNTWTTISPDLTKGANGRLGTITCMSNAVLPTSQRVIYTGADDGRVMVTTNSGTNWIDISGGLPVRYVTDVVTDKRNPAIAYVTLSGFNMDLNNTHIFRTVNYGQSWTNISNNLLNVPANSLIVDYNKDSTLFVGTDAGVYYTTRLGAIWTQLGTGLPNAPVFDLVYHQSSAKLIAATHGRSMFELDISNLPSGVNNNGQTVSGFVLKQNYPNPFNPETNISFEIKEKSFVTLKVFDLSGKEVANLVNGTKSAGSYTVKFNGANLASGVYFYKLESGEYSEVKKMSLIK